MCCYGNQQLQLADVKHFQIFTNVSGMEWLEVARREKRSSKHETLPSNLWKRKLGTSRKELPISTHLLHHIQKITWRQFSLSIGFMFNLFKFDLFSVLSFLVQKLINGLYRYGRPQRVWVFFIRYGHK